MVRQKSQIEVVEFESQRILLLDLVNGVQELQEGWREAARLRISIEVAPIIIMIIIVQILIIVSYL